MVDTTRKRIIAADTAALLIEAKAILFAQDEPFTLTSGMKSPVYTDMRKVIAFPAIRSRLVDHAVETIAGEIGTGALDVIAGGETAGIPFAAWISDRLALEQAPEGDKMFHHNQNEVTKVVLKPGLTIAAE